MVAQTSWIKEIVQKQCPVRDVALGKHLLTPHFMVGLDLNLTTKQQPSQIPDGDVDGDMSSAAATSLQSRYTAVWNKLEQDCSDSAPESKFLSF